MTKPWNMCSVRQRQPVRKYRPVGPVGEQPLIDWGGARVDSAHRCCGMHVCMCPPKREPQGPGYWCSKCRRGHGDCVFVGIGMRSCVDVNDPTPQSPFTYKHGATCTCIDCCERRKS